MFQSIGERFNIGITIVVKKFKRCIKLKKSNVTQTELTILACFLCSFVLLGGAGMFHYFEGWSFENAFYYCFITMSTIGFGDFVALQKEEAMQKRPDYVAVSILYILFGLTVFAAALNLMVLRLLTMNTEDERKDELEALAAARGAAKLDGDVITSGTTNTAMTTIGMEDEEGITVEADSGSNSHCYNPPRKKRRDSQFCNGVITYPKPRFSAKRGPSRIGHLLPMQQIANGLSSKMSQETLMAGEESEPLELVTSLNEDEYKLDRKRCSV